MTHWCHIVIKPGAGGMKIYLVAHCMVVKARDSLSVPLLSALSSLSLSLSSALSLSLSSLSLSLSLSSLSLLTHHRQAGSLIWFFSVWQLRNYELKIRLCCDFLLNGFWFVFIFLPRAGSWTFLRGGDVQFQIELVYNLSQVCSSWWHEICKWPACFERKWTAKLSMNKCQTDTIHLNRMYSGILYTKMCMCSALKIVQVY